MNGLWESRKIEMPEWDRDVPPFSIRISDGKCQQSGNCILSFSLCDEKNAMEGIFRDSHMINPVTRISGLSRRADAPPATLGDSRCKPLSITRFRAISPMDEGRHQQLGTACSITGATA